MTRAPASKRMKKEINAFAYPLSETSKGFLERLIIFRPIFYSSKLAWLFHIMMLLGITSCVGMDLLFAITKFDHAILEPGGIAYPFRIFHRWALLVFGLVLVAYILQLLFNHQLREGLERIDYAEFVLLLIFTIYGMSYSWNLGLWGTYVKDFGVPENISDYTFHIVIPDSPSHALLGYGWLLLSLLGGGLLRKALANVLLQLSRVGLFPTPKEKPKPFKIEPTSPRGLFDATNFGIIRFANLYACGKCGNCNDVCPVYQGHENVVIAPRTRVANLRKVVTSQKGLLARIVGPRQPSQPVVEELKQGTFMECTICGRCATVCPSGLDLADLWLEARSSFHKAEQAPPKILTVEKAIIEEKNVFAMDNDDRGMFFDFPDEEHADIAYFMGCLTSFSGALEVVGQAVGDILSILGDKWVILRSDEWCCGLPLKLLGNQDSIHKLAKHNIARLEALGVKKVVFNCPGCYKTFKHLYPELLGNALPFVTQHIVELVKEALDQGRLKPKGKYIVGKLTYYDPCELTRYLGVYEEPRDLLRQLTAGFVELEENRNYTHCCGAGGGLRLVNNQMSLKMSPEVIQMAINVGATTLVTACPACVQILKETAALNKENGAIEATDIVAILAKHIARGDCKQDSNMEDKIQ
ncbi:MAG: (Fe-S)-binding protein [Candidatus Heimdallarchaeota archaeon]